MHYRNMEIKKQTQEFMIASYYFCLQTYKETSGIKAGIRRYKTVFYEICQKNNVFHIMNRQKEGDS